VYTLGHGRYAIDLASVVVFIDAGRLAINAGALILRPILITPSYQQIRAARFRRACCGEATVRKKSKRSFERGDRRYGMQVTVALGGMRSGVGGARHHPTPPLCAQSGHSQQLSLSSP
jgi:hypothetical protein